VSSSCKKMAGHLLDITGIARVRQLVSPARFGKSAARLKKAGGKEAAPLSSFAANIMQPCSRHHARSVAVRDGGGGGHGFASGMAAVPTVPDTGLERVEFALQ